MHQPIAEIDGIGAGLAALVLRLETAAAQIDRDPAAARATLLELREQAKAIVADVRGLAAVIES